MFRVSRAVRFAPLLAAVALAAVGCKQVAPGDEDDNEELAANGCGVERWAVKTGTDSAASTVNMTPQDTTITALGALAVPAGLTSNSGRFPNSAETQVWRLTNVTLVQYKLETDSDYHLVLTDSTGKTMIAEIPSPSCVSGGPWQSSITAARAALDAKFTVTGSFQTANVPVTITGAGFFDLQHGQTGVAPNAIELHGVLSICFPGSTVSGCAASTPDFSLAANPASLSTAQGATGTTAVSVAGSGGFSGTVALSASGLPAGASASFSAASIGAGASSTLTLAAGSAAAGNYTVTISGTSGTNTHTATVAWAITSSGGGGGGTAVVNGDFEAGSLSGWTSTGTTAVVSTGAHGGTYAARVGSTSASTDSTLSQTITLPAGSPSLSFWYKVVCPDTITYDWASVTVKSSSGTVLTTPLANTCTNTGAWVQKTVSLASWAGQTVVLSLNNHDDNYSGDPTYTLYDDVSISGGSTGAPDFTLTSSAGSLSGSGTATITTTAVSGFTGSVALSASGVPSGASASFSPTSINVAGSSTLTLTAGSAAAGNYTVTVTGTSGTLAHTATIAWTIAGSGGGNAVTNGNFETGSLSGWTSAGTTAVVSSGAHGGTYAARVGSTSASTDSSIKQTLTLPAGSPTLSFWYQVVCPDTITYDWASVTVTSTSGTVLATPLANTCSNSGAWVQVTTSLATWAGQTVVLSFNNHDDNYSGDPTYTLYDDISVSGGSTPAPSFALSASSGAVSSTGGASASATISAAPQNGFSSAVALSVSGVPTGASASFSPTSIAGGSGSSTLTLAPGSAAAGTYPLTITGSGGGVTQSVSVSWTISSGATASFALSASSSALSSAGSAAATTTITSTAQNGWNTAVALSISGVPTGASASFSPASIAGGSGSSTLTLTPGTAPAGSYSLTVSGSGGGQTHTVALTWTLTASGGTGIQTVFLILMENHNWSDIQGSASAPYINNTVLPQASYANNYQNVPGLHPSLPNYLWLEAGTNFGVTADGDVSSFPQSSTQHLVTLLQNAGITWKSYQENITGSTCPLTTSGLYAPKHNPMVYFNDVNNNQNASSSNCIAHVRPYTELATDLANNSVARYNFITPNLCNDMHNSSGCATTDEVRNGDNWLANNLPTILSSAAYRNGGAVFITWDETEGSGTTVPMIVLSPKAKGGGYNNSIAYSHSSTLRTMQTIFNVQPFLGDAANATDLRDLFTSFP